MKSEKNLSLLNCLATALLACFITVPGHELFHLLTHMVYGSKLLMYSAGAVDALVEDYTVFSPFHRIMVAGGSASILNAIIGIILLVILFKVKMGSLQRVFLTQLMGAQMVQGIGYFLVGGLFGAGDWGAVYAQLTDYPGLVLFLRILLSILGAGGIVALFFILNYMSYYFIENKDDRKERQYVAFRLHLLVLFCGFAIGMICTAVSPALESGELTILLGVLYNIMWIPFFWAYMYTAFMVKPPKEGRFLYHLPTEPHYVLLAVSVILVLFEIFVLGPGIRLG